MSKPDGRPCRLSISLSVFLYETPNFGGATAFIGSHSSTSADEFQNGETHE